MSQVCGDTYIEQFHNFSINFRINCFNVLEKKRSEIFLLFSATCVIYMLTFHKSGSFFLSSSSFSTSRKYSCFIQKRIYDKRFLAQKKNFSSSVTLRTHCSCSVSNEKATVFDKCKAESLLYNYEIRRAIGPTKSLKAFWSFLVLRDFNLLCIPTLLNGLKFKTSLKTSIFGNI